MGSFEYQVVISISAVILAMCAALLCDYLRLNNARLRRRNATLLARLRLGALSRETALAVVAENSAGVDAASEDETAAPARPDPLSTQVLGAEFLTAPVESAVVPCDAEISPESVAPVMPRLRRNSRPLRFDPSLAADILSRHQKQMTACSSTSPDHQNHDLHHLHVATGSRFPVEPAPSELLLVGAGNAPRELAGVELIGASSPHTSTLSPRHLRNSQRAGRPLVPADRAGLGDVQMPGGFHVGRESLEPMLGGDNGFTGLVVAILLRTQGQPSTGIEGHYERVMATVARTVRSLGRDQDFVCRTDPNEYILLFPDEIEQLAERRTRQVADRLWDFQLRVLGSFSIAFQWGAVETNGDSLHSAIEEARRRALDAVQFTVETQTTPLGAAAGA